MMMFLKQGYRFIVLILLQVFLLNNLQISDYGIIFIYIYFILFLPLSLKPWQVLIVSFLAGFIIDITSGTYGLHMATATFIGFIKNYVLRLIVGKDFEDEVEIFTLSKLKLSQSIFYMMLLSFIFCVLFFALDFFSLKALQKYLLQISISSVVTFVSLFIYQQLFTRKA